MKTIENHKIKASFCLFDRLGYANAMICKEAQ
ncbi:hypothetical protein [Coxiella burnetii]|uniref:Uncharacterized protein n=2 Tax=Coxiella burnetii TaxID=777 RepID=Q83E80_COXBU|nr:hypothetical protein [Coxiella burnetii]NP_819485.1 hypothetical protein CBU_0448 [Coxiella burnetii RSA 493]AAO89999.1 hypothetical protein CBU_0448 [Coxiella burnetii RSA 493]ACI23192.1 hypothetical protein CBUD_1625a [Coxiella burnetii Dugway 5J108-111]ACJ18857.1 hypothetical protein CbuG_1563 [Coxiella burnetii CbuG_Q212]ACJ20584.1 hypothetical protein CbuK_1410 [Coxiella burnetii CbuK_Q154]AML49617.1 hypothetical protein AUR58_10930 [Coxiella burnetii]